MTSNTVVGLLPIWAVMSYVFDADLLMEVNLWVKSVCCDRCYFSRFGRLSTLYSLTKGSLYLLQILPHPRVSVSP